MAITLNDKEKEFSGAISECEMEYVDEYKIFVCDYGFSVS